MFRYLHILIAAAATAAVIGFIGYVFYTPATKTETVTVERPIAPATVQEINDAYGEPDSIVQGPDVGLPAGVVCGVWQPSDQVQIVACSGGTQ